MGGCLQLTAWAQQRQAPWTACQMWTASSGSCTPASSSSCASSALQTKRSFCPPSQVCSPCLHFHTGRAAVHTGSLRLYSSLAKGLLTPRDCTASCGVTSSLLSKQSLQHCDLLPFKLCLVASIATGPPSMLGVFQDALPIIATHGSKTFFRGMKQSTKATPLCSSNPNPKALCSCSCT